jgi:hypothetical protein
METTQITTQMTLSGCLPELEVPMINTMMACLGREHAKLDGQILQLALAATSLAREPEAPAAKQRAVEAWEEIHRDLWSHLQIEDGLVYSWGEAHQALSGTLLNSLKSERQTLHKLVAALHELASGEAGESETRAERSNFARTLLALAQTLDSHVERYNGQVRPSILRALFQR